MAAGDNDAAAAALRDEGGGVSTLGRLGYRFQFVTLAGFHALNAASFELAAGYKDYGMKAYSDLQQREFGLESRGYTATRHQREVRSRFKRKARLGARGRGALSFRGHADSAGCAEGMRGGPGSLRAVCHDLLFFFLFFFFPPRVVSLQALCMGHGLL